MSSRPSASHPDSLRAAPVGSRLRWLSSPLAAGVVLATFWFCLSASLRDKSLTYDEIAHAAAGYSYWHFGDYRLQPENGQLPQRVAGLSLALSGRIFPAPDPVAWRDAEVWLMGNDWFYGPGGDAAELSARGRLYCGGFAVALGALVWAWARRLFGPLGGMLSLLLFVLNPTVLANGALMTSDMAAALFFVAAAWTMWELLNRLTLGRLLASALPVGALFLSKSSAVLIVPVALLLIVVRLADGRPLLVEFFRGRRELSSRPGQALVLAGAVVVHAAVAAALIWACYGFRYSAFAAPGAADSRFLVPWEYLLGKPEPLPALQSLKLSEDQKFRVERIFKRFELTERMWSNKALDAMEVIRRETLLPEQVRQLDALLAEPSPTWWMRGVELIRQHRLLPEAWSYGLAHAFHRAQWRSAFLNGDFRMDGWWWFFPYTFLLKTPLALFGVMALAVATVWRRRGAKLAGSRTLRASLYATLPLWVLPAVYWTAALTSHLNIGHRHLLPVYPPLFVLCGAAAGWIKGWRAHRTAKGRAPSDGKTKRAGVALIGLLLVLAVEAAFFFPNYLAYFNGIVRPREAYRHLVDSSLDWGQDLPAVRRYIERHPPVGGPYYFSYFGSANPDYYGIAARGLFSVNGLHLRRSPVLQYLMMSPEEATANLPTLPQRQPDYDVLGAEQVRKAVFATLLKKPEFMRLGSGTYLISASLLQPVYYSLAGPWGPWNARHEATYQRLYATVKPLLVPEPGARAAALNAHTYGEWPGLLRNFDEYRFARLTAWLRLREPDDEINYSILVYHLTEADLARALDGPPPAFGPDRAATETLKMEAAAAR